MAATLAAATIAPDSAAASAGAQAVEAASKRTLKRTTNAVATPPPAPPGLTVVRADEEMLWTQEALGISQSSHTGLSQDVAFLDMGSSARGSGTVAAVAASGVADMDIDGDRAIHTASAAADSSTPASSVDVALRRDVLVQFLEAEIGRHLVLVQASAGPHSQVAVQFPTNWRDLRN